MTSYFDNLTAQIRGLSQSCDRVCNDVPKADEKFLAELARIEAEVATIVRDCVGDREFPEDLGKRALAILDHKSIVPDAKPAPSIVDYAQSLRSSMMLEELHSFFHVVAGRRIATRFGWLSDSPKGNVDRRKDHDAEGGL